MVHKQTMAGSKNESTDVFHIYSGHDMTLSVLLSSLGVYNVTFPPYSAAILVELRYKEGDHYVTVSSKSESFYAQSTYMDFS